MKTTRRQLMQLAAATAAVGLAAPARVHATESFYRGRTVRMLVGSPPGGGYDSYARMIAPYLADRLGAEVVVDNRPGGGGLLALNMLTSETPNGLSLMHVSAEGAMMSQLSGRAGARFDVGELNWLARVAAESRLWFVNAESEIDTVADARAAERIRWSATGPADNISDVAAIISHALGLNSQIITGYQGARDMALAVVNGEVDSGVISGTSVLSLVQSGRIKPIAMISRQRWDVLPDVPTIYEADGLDAEGISWLEMREDMGAVQRAMVTTPNVPEDRVAFLREVFDDVLNDPALVEEGATSNRPITYLPGEELRVLIGELMEFASGDRLEELRRIILQTYL